MNSFNIHSLIYAILKSEYIFFIWMSHGAESQHSNMKVLVLIFTTSHILFPTDTRRKTHDHQHQKNGRREVRVRGNQHDGGTRERDRRVDCSRYVFSTFLFSFMHFSASDNKILICSTTWSAFFKTHMCKCNQVPTKTPGAFSCGNACRWIHLKHTHTYTSYEVFVYGQSRRESRCLEFVCLAVGRLQRVIDPV